MESSVSSNQSVWGWFALVCYVPEPQKSCLDILRETAGGRALPPVHITVLPPRPLSLPVERACDQVETLAGRLSSFEAGLSEVRFFENSEFLYLDISAGSESICTIHEQLSSGGLAFPEIYEFRPHVTLAGPIPAASLPSAQSRLADQWNALDCPRLVPIEELVCLWSQSGTEDRQWERIRSIHLPGGIKQPSAANGVRNQR